VLALQAVPNVSFAEFPIKKEKRKSEIAVRYLRGCERVVVRKHVRVIGHVCFCKKKFRLLTFAPDSELGLLAGQCFELCLVQSVIIPSSVEVIGMSNFRNPNIKTFGFVRGSCLQRLNPSGLQDVHCGRLNFQLGLTHCQVRV
jgi:hypothetical protein